MTRRYKIILFWSIVVLFLISAPVLIFYTQGYKYDWQNKKIVQTGGLFVKISPASAKIYIDKKISGKTNFIFSSAFINGLVPGEYEIRIEKPGFHPWQKSLKIEEQQVTEGKYIQLFPREPDFSFLFSGITNFYPSPDQETLITKKQDKDIWQLESYNLSNNSFQTLASSTQLLKLLELKGGPTPQLQDITWSNDAKKIILQTRLKGEKKYFIADILTAEVVPLDIKGNIKNISFNPQNSEEIFFIGDNIKKATTTAEEEPQYFNETLFQYRPNQEKPLTHITLPFLEEKVIAYYILDNQILWLNKAGFLYKGELRADRVELSEILNLKPLPIVQGANYKIIAPDFTKIFLKQDQSLYFLVPETHFFKQVFADLKEYSFSDDGVKLALKNEYEIWILFLKKEEEQPEREKQEKYRLIGLPDEISNLFWLNNHYLIFKAGDSINIIEIDNRDQPNLIEFTTFPDPKIAWLKKAKTLLVLSRANLFLSKDVLK